MAGTGMCTWFDKETGIDVIHSYSTQQCICSMLVVLLGKSPLAFFSACDHGL